jgi:nucleoside-diphosphate-sugar epimerase
MSSPRHDATARWLMENPDQDPGSDYGVQKRECRDLLHVYASQHGFDSRFIIIPGVLHTQVCRM